jgi:hypothetical protein
MKVDIQKTSARLIGSNKQPGAEEHSAPAPQPEPEVPEHVWHQRNQRERRMCARLKAY